ncbi:hypothetical protein ACJX0J_038107 [Zea mays]
MDLLLYLGINGDGTGGSLAVPFHYSRIEDCADTKKEIGGGRIIVDWIQRIWITDVYEIQDHSGKGCRKILHLLGTFAFQIFIHLCFGFCHIHHRDYLLYL